MPGKMQLRELLTEVSDRVAEIVEVRDRLDRLIEAMLMVASNLDLDETLRRIVHAAVELDTPLDIELGGSPPGGTVNLRSCGCSANHISLNTSHATW